MNAATQHTRSRTWIANEQRRSARPESTRRASVRAPLLVLVALLGAAMAGANDSDAATITVTSYANSGPGTLRQALQDANDGDTISLVDVGAIDLVDPLVVNKSVAIAGPGAANLWVFGSGGTRAFYIGVGKTVTMSGITITNGFADYGAGGAGGAIYNDHATLTLRNCNIVGNGAASAGGGIYNDGSQGSAALTIDHSSVAANFVLGSGGGIYNNGNGGTATLTISNSPIRDNTSAAYGGGIFNDAMGTDGGGPVVRVDSSTLSGNSAGSDGGGIFNKADGHATATVTIGNSTVSGNSATNTGGAVVNAGVDAFSSLTIVNSTLSDNSATVAGGIYNAANRGGAVLTIGGTILKTGPAGENIFNFGTVTTHGYNLSNDDAGGFLTGPGDRINADPMLGPLQDNGGRTLTHALSPASPAVDAGDPGFMPSQFDPPMLYDQRGTGFDRLVGGRVDIGAFELPAPTSPYAGLVQQPINADGTSVFSVKRGVVPVKFALTQGGVATCDLPPATIAVTRTAGGTTGGIDESVYAGAADTGSSFRIDSCQYTYNLSSSSLGAATYRVDIKIAGQAVGSALFQLK